jgi:hypothetical protein
MGASSFIARGKGNSAREAFNEAVQEACWEHGHGGYTGTIAEKDSFVMIDEKEMTRAEIRDYIETHWEDERIQDKWGPAGCLKENELTYWFFGYASD